MSGKREYCRGCHREITRFNGWALTCPRLVLKQQMNGGPFLRSLVGGRVPHHPGICAEVHEPSRARYAWKRPTLRGPPKSVRPDPLPTRRIGVPRLVLTDRIRMAAFRATRRALGVRV